MSVSYTHLYRKGGPLTVTDANLALGRLLPEYFPKIFGEDEMQPLDKQATLNAFAELTDEVTRAIFCVLHLLLDLYVLSIKYCIMDYQILIITSLVLLGCLCLVLRHSVFIHKTKTGIESVVLVSGIAMWSSRFLFSHI